MGSHQRLTDHFTTEIYFICSKKKYKYILPFYVCYAGVLSAPVPFPLSHGCNFPQIDPATLLSRAWLSTNKPGLLFFSSSPFIYSLHLFCLIGAQHNANSNRLPSVKGRIRGEFKRSRKKNRKMHSYPCGVFLFMFFNDAHHALDNSSYISNLA